MFGKWQAVFKPHCLFSLKGNWLTSKQFQKLKAYFPPVYLILSLWSQSLWKKKMQFEEENSKIHQNVKKLPGNHSFHHIKALRIWESFEKVFSTHTYMWIIVVFLWKLWVAKVYICCSGNTHTSLADSDGPVEINKQINHTTCSFSSL